MMHFEGFSNRLVKLNIVNRGTNPPPVGDESRALPYDARTALIAASQIIDPRARAHAIEEATNEARARYPALFQKVRHE